MSIVGFSFLKFDAERKAPAVGGNIEINHNVSIKNVVKTNLNVGGNKSDVLRVEFDFVVNYSNNVGKIAIVGDVIYADTKEIIEETAKGWDIDKKLNSLVHEEVVKFIYTKAIVKALELSDSLNLPSPIPMPKVNFSEKKKN